jgi:hypothetical protein
MGLRTVQSAHLSIDSSMNKLCPGGYPERKNRVFDFLPGRTVLGYWTLITMLFSFNLLSYCVYLSKFYCKICSNKIKEQIKYPKPNRPSQSSASPDPPFEFQGIAYIKFSRTYEAALAMEEMNGQCIAEDPRPLKVLIAHAKDQVPILPNTIFPILHIICKIFSQICMCKISYKFCEK